MKVYLIVHRNEPGHPGAWFGTESSADHRIPIECTRAFTSYKDARVFLGLEGEYALRHHNHARAMEVAWKIVSVELAELPEATE